MEKEPNLSEKNFGHELMAKAEELFKKDAKEGVAKYGFPGKDWEFLNKDLQQFGFKEFLEKSIGKPILLISPERLTIVEIERYGKFIVPPGLLISNKKIVINEEGKNINLLIRELGKTNGFKLALNTETIPTKENIICQYQQFALIVNAYNNYFFLEENFLITGNRNQGEMEELEITKIKRPELKEIRLFQKILKKNLINKNLNY